MIAGLIAILFVCIMLVLIINLVNIVEYYECGTYKRELFFEYIEELRLGFKIFLILFFSPYLLITKIPFNKIPFDKIFFKSK